MSKYEYGIGDPYWYEWTVGLQQIILMLQPEHRIKTVTLQASHPTPGWDDVVVEYEPGHFKYYQVKHTRQLNTLTFGDLVSSDGGESLLSRLAKAWLQLPYNPENKFLVFTNRGAGQRSFTTQNGFKRPPLEKFLTHIKEQISLGANIDSLCTDETFRKAYDTEWRAELKDLNKDEQIKFLKQFDVEAGKEDLADFGALLESTLQLLFGVNEATAKDLLSSLDSALRNWTTTLRATEKINTNDVFNVLRKPKDEIIGDHQLVPPTPFFASREVLANELNSLINQGTERVIFLTGEPGSGKTSLISALTNRRNPTIHFRYYTFRPISPESKLMPVDSGRTIEPRVLWGDLLSQLRIALKDRLAQLQVPIRNDFIDNIDDLRRHVIRLAVEYSKIIRQRVVICIDGIDHAARAEILKNQNYLATLPLPEHIPEQVLFLICGQPPEGYEGYPPWLRTENSAVKRMKLPPVSTDDVRALLRSSNSFPSLAEVLLEKTKGSTLSILYAIQAIRECKTVEEAIETLHDHDMQSGLIAYYDTIWQKATRDFGRIGLLEALGAVFSLSSARLKPENLTKVLSDYSLNVTEWTSVLNKLSPLIIREASGYRPLHNDVRVYLTKTSRSLDENLYKEIASNLVRLYLNEPDFTFQKHTELSFLIQKCNEKSLVFDLLEPKHFVEAQAVRAPRPEVESIIKIAFTEAIEQKRITDLHRLACCIQTVSQFDRFDRDVDIANEANGTLSIHELRVLTRGVWTESLVSEVLRLVESLLLANQFERASGLWDRWFSDLSLSEIIDHLREEASDREDGPNFGASMHFFNHIRLLGRVAFHLGLASDEGMKDQVCASFNGGLLEAVQGVTSLEQWRGFFDLFSGSVFHRDVNNSLAQLAGTKEWRTIAFFQRKLNPELLTGAWRNVAYLTALWTRNERNIRKYAISFEAICNNLKTVDHQDYTAETKLAALSSFLLGWKESFREPRIVAHELCEAVFFRGHDARARVPMNILLTHAFKLGRCFREVIDREQSFVYLTFDEFEKILVGLFDFPNTVRGSIHLTNSNEGVSILVEILQHCATQSGGQFLSRMLEAYKLHFSNATYSSKFSSYWRLLYSMGNYAECKDLLDRLVGHSGTLWEWDLDSKMSILRELKDLVKGTQYDEQILHAERKMEWHQVGFSGHKDYALYRDYSWFLSIAQRHPERWQVEGVQLLKLSASASEVGDNRARYEIETGCFFAALRHSPTHAWCLYQELMIVPIDLREPDILVSTFQKNFQNLGMTEDEAKLAWLAFAGVTNWLDHYSGEAVEEFRSAARERFGEGFIEFMAGSAPVTNHLAELHRRRLTENESSTNDCATLDEYLTLDRANANQLKKLAAAFVNGTREFGFAEKLNLVLTHIFTHFSYRSEWEGNIGEIFEILIPFLPQETQWFLARDIYKSYYDATGFRSLYTLGISIDIFCRSMSIGTTSNLIRGFRRLTSMHRSWIAGFDSARAVGPASNSSTRIAGDESSWLDQAMKVLLNKFASRSGLQIEPALRGFFAIARNSPDSLRYVNDNWSSLNDDQREYVIFLLEPILRAGRTDEIALQLLEKGKRSALLSIRLQAFLAGRESGIDPLLWNLELKESPILRNTGSILPNPGALLEMQDASAQTLGVHHSFNRRLNLMTSIFPWLDQDLVKSQLIFLYDVKTKERIARPARKLREDFVLSDRTERDVFDEVIEHHISGVSLGEMTKLHFSQYMLTDEDPMLLFNDYVPFPNPSEMERESITQDLLFEIAHQGLGPNDILLSGEIRMVKSTKVHSLQLNRLIQNSKHGLEMPGVINARSSFWPDGIKDKGSDQFLFSIGYGTTRFVGLNNWLCPNPSVFSRVDWELNRGEGIEFRKGGQRTAWLQRCIGPFNHQLYRDVPQMQRWICDKESFRELCDFFKTDLAIQQDYSVRNVD